MYDNIGNKTTWSKYGFASTSSPSVTSHLTENVRLEKWGEMLQSWDKSLHTSKFKRRVRKGIPSGIRGAIWFKLTDAGTLKARYSQNYYFALVDSEEEFKQEMVIRNDLNRTFPTNIMFRSDDGLEMLMRILKAYALFDPQLGYTQGMNYIAALLLILLPEEDAFWVLVSLMQKYKFRECFTEKMPRVNTFFYVANGLLRHKIPKLFRHFDREGLSISMYSTQWFMTGFTVSFPFESAVRIWDCFLYEGEKILYRVYLGILKLIYKELIDHSFENCLLVLKRIQDVDPNKLLRVSFGIRLSRSLITRLARDFEERPKKKYINWTYEGMPV